MDKVILIASPVYNAMCSNHYKHAEIKAARALVEAGIPHGFCDNAADSLVPRSRDYLAEVFMRNEKFTHLMFVDADISFEPESLLTLIESSSPNPDDDPHGVIGGLYPKKEINWETVARMVKAGVPPKELHRYCSPPVLNAVRKVGDVYEAFSKTIPLEVTEVGTGFMLIRRDVFVKINEQLATREQSGKYPYTPIYRPNHQGSEHFNDSLEITGFFFCVKNPETEHLLSEDYAFCHRARAVGEKVWAHPGPKLVHHGNYAYSFELPPVEAINQDPSLLDQSVPVAA